MTLFLTHVTCSMLKTAAPVLRRSANTKDFFRCDLQLCFFLPKSTLLANLTLVDQRSKIRPPAIGKASLERALSISDTYTNSAFVLELNYIKRGPLYLLQEAGMILWERGGGDVEPYRNANWKGRKTNCCATLLNAINL